MQIIFNSEFQASRSTIACKRGDDLILELVFLTASREIYIPDWDSVVFAAKERGDYVGDFLLRTDGFAYSQTEDGKPCLRLEMRMNGKLLSELIGNKDTITIFAEFEFRRVGYVVSSQTLSLVIDNDIIKGIEGTDNDFTPEYATIRYVDEAIINHINLAKGEPGDTPWIGDNGHWWIGNEDTGGQAVVDMTAVNERLESKSEIIVIKEDDYENMAEKNPRTLYIIN